MKIVVWLPHMDHHYAYTWLHVQSLTDVKPIFVLNSIERSVRKEQGWNAVPLDDFHVIMLKRRGWSWQAREIIRENSDAIHVFFGFLGESRFLMLILYSLYLGIKVAIMNESYSLSPVGYVREESMLIALFKVWLRPILYWLFAQVSILFTKASPPCILPLSLIAHEQFLKAGFGKNSIFTFGYFVPRADYSFEAKRNRHSTLRLIFVGSLIRRKGLDIAIQAIETLSDLGNNIQLDIYGPGKPESFISGSSSCIHYLGPIKSTEVQSVIARYDALILPSRHDGWGVVVNESLLQGVPVIVSDHVGAKCLVENTGAGVVFKSEDVGSLMVSLEELNQEPKRLENLREKARQIGNFILPEVAAHYILDVFHFYFYDNRFGKRPNAIWCTEITEEKYLENLNQQC